MRLKIVLALFAVAWASQGLAQTPDAFVLAMDLNKDGRITLEELKESSMKSSIATFDLNNDGTITREEISTGFRNNPAAAKANGRLMTALDTNHDGAISMEERTAQVVRAFGVSDRNQDGWLSMEEASLMINRPMPRAAADAQTAQQAQPAQP